MNIDYELCGKKLQGVKRNITCTLPKDHKGMCGLVDLTSFRWIDKCLTDEEIMKLSSGELNPDDVD